MYAAQTDTAFSPGLRFFSPANAASGTAEAAVLWEAGEEPLLNLQKKGVYLQAGWVTLGHDTYYFDNSGRPYRGPHRIDGEIYLFSPKGVLFKRGWLTSAAGVTWYFSPADGRMYTGVNKIGGKDYLFDRRGALLRNSSVSTLVTGPDGVIDEAKSRRITTLKKDLQTQILSYPGTWSIYVCDMATGETLTIHNQKMYAASLIKLFAMGTAYSEAAAGRLEETRFDGLIPPMIASSSNSAFNTLFRMLGGGTVSLWCRTNGYFRTAAVHGLSPADNDYDLVFGPGTNVTSCADVGKFLEDVYNGTCVNRLYSYKMLRALKLITDDKSLYYRSKLPSGVPEGVTVANKTGDVSDYSHDAAIIFSPGTDYVISVMAHVPGRGYNCSSYFGEISRTVYTFFNPSDQ